MISIVQNKLYSYTACMKNFNWSFLLLHASNEYNPCSYMYMYITKQYSYCLTCKTCMCTCNWYTPITRTCFTRYGSSPYKMIPL